MILEFIPIFSLPIFITLLNLCTSYFKFITKLQKFENASSVIKVETMVVHIYDGEVSMKFIGRLQSISRKTSIYGCNNTRVGANKLLMDILRSMNEPNIQMNTFGYFGCCSFDTFSL